MDKRNQSNEVQEIIKRMTTSFPGSLILPPSGAETVGTRVERMKYLRENVRHLRRT